MDKTQTKSEHFVNFSKFTSVLSWHPDKNQGSPDARKRFQRVKDAFDEIKRRQVNNARPIHQAHRGKTQPSGANYFCRYTWRQARNPYGSASSYSDSERYSTYYRARSQRSSRSAWEEAARTVTQARIRMGRPIGLVGVIFAASLLVSSVALSTEFVWRANNRGKSFEDLVNSLDTGDDSRVPPNRKMKRNTRRRAVRNRLKTNQPQEPQDDP